MKSLDFIYNRKSVRKFKDSEVPREDIIKMLDAAIHAPSPKNQQTWHFVVIQNKELINKIADIVEKNHTNLAEMAKVEKQRKLMMNLLPYYRGGYRKFLISSNRVGVWNLLYDRTYSF